MDCEEERRRVVEWATIDPIASAMDVDFWMRERRLRDGGYRWQRRGGDWDWGSWSEEEEKWPDANFAAVHIHKTIRYPIVIVVDYQYSRFLLERLLLCQWPKEILMIIESLRPGPISLHTHRHTALLFRLVVSSHRQVKSFLMASSLLMFGRFSLILTPDADVYTYKSPLPAIAERSSDKFQPLLLRFSGSNVNLLCDGEIESSLVSSSRNLFLSWSLLLTFVCLWLLLIDCPPAPPCVDDLHKSLDELCLFELKFGRCKKQTNRKRWSERKREHSLCRVYLFYVS